jgi:hypothetical protein
MAKPLSEVQIAEDEFLVDGFRAEIAGVPITVVAVLERTCVYTTPEGDRRLASKSDIMVDPKALPIKRRGMG